MNGKTFMEVFFRVQQKMFYIAKKITIRFDGNVVGLLLSSDVFFERLRNRFLCLNELEWQTESLW